MWKRVVEYANDAYLPMHRFMMNENSLIERAAFTFLVIIYTILIILRFILLLATAPLWIIPYLIYYSMKYKKRGKK